MFDIIVVAVVIIFVMLGYSKGIILSALRFVTWILSFILARIFSPVLAEFFIETQYFNSLNSFVSERLVNIEKSGIQNFTNSLSMAKAGQSSGVIGDLLIEGIKSQKVIDSSNIINFLSLSLSTMLVRIGSMILVFILLSILFAIFLKFVKGFVQLPVIKQLDKIGGAILGVLEGIIISYVVILIISMLKIGGVEGDFQNTVLVKYFLNVDLLKKAYIMVSQ